MTDKELRKVVNDWFAYSNKNNIGGNAETAEFYYAVTMLMLMFESDTIKKAKAVMAFSDIPFRKEVSYGALARVGMFVGAMIFGEDDKDAEKIFDDVHESIERLGAHWFEKKGRMI